MKSLKEICEGIFDIDSNIDKISEDPSIILNKKCKNFDEVIECIANYFGVDKPKITKSSRVLRKFASRDGIRLYNDNLVEFKFEKNNNTKTLIFAEWSDSLVMQIVYNRKVVALEGIYNEFEWGSSLWEWLKQLLNRGRIPSWTFNKYKD